MTVVSGEPSTAAASVACARSSGPALSSPTVNAGIGSPRCRLQNAEDDRRVQPAADVADDRHVAPQPALDGLSQERLELLDQRRRIVEPAFRAGVGEVEVPVAVLGDPAVPDPEKMPRRQRLDPLEERPRRARAEEREEVVDAARVGPRRRPCPRPGAP